MRHWRPSAPTRVPPAGRALLAAALAAVLVVAGCTEDDESSDAAGTTTTAAVEACRGDDLLECARSTLLADFAPDEPMKATGAPIRLGMINTETAQIGAFPEMSRAARAAVRFINEQLGGIDGRPLELDVCDAEFSAEGSQACGQRYAGSDVVAVLGGIDVFGNGIDVLADNGIPFLGGVPVSTASVTSPVSFQFSGGTWGAAIAFADYAVNELDAKKVAFVYGDLGSIRDGAQYGVRVLEAAGAEAIDVPVPILTTDYAPAIQAVVAQDPDAIVVLAADTACVPAFRAVATQAPDVQLFMTGACLAPKILAEAGSEVTDGVIVNSEGLGDPDDPDLALYRNVLAAYDPSLDAQTAGGLSFRSVINLFLVLSELDGEITPESVRAAFAAQRDAPAFAGHPYTCDGKQLAGLPAVCAPQQELLRLEGSGYEPITDWIDVGGIYADATAG